MTGVTDILGTRLVEFDVYHDGLYTGSKCHCQRDGCDLLTILIILIIVCILIDVLKKYYNLQVG